MTNGTTYQGAEMKKLLLFLSLLFIMSLSVFAGETFKCRKETFFYDIEGGTSSNEFLFINNFMIFPHDGYYRKYIFFIRDDKTGDYEAFGEYYPSYLARISSLVENLQKKRKSLKF